MKQKHDRGFPSRDAIVAFIRDYPGDIGTREIARRFGLKNADRAELKRILRELADAGTITKRGNTITEAFSLPATVLADISSRVPKSGLPMCTSLCLTGHYRSTMDPPALAPEEF